MQKIRFMMHYVCLLKEFNMVKRGLIVLVLVAVIVGGAFAQYTPRNALTVDFGPTIIGAAFGALGNLIGEEGLSTSGFGIGAQYELQPFEKVSFALRGAYLGFGFGVSQEEGSSSAKLNLDMNSFSIEGHVRVYPFSGAFFVDGMGGYGRLAMGLSGKVIVNEGGYRFSESVSETISRNYVKLGGKLGWRFCFGKNGGGFTFEPSLGYYGKIGFGDTFGKQLSNLTNGEIADMADFDKAFGYVEKYLFIGGPRISLAVGWRF